MYYEAIEYVNCPNLSIYITCSCISTGCLFSSQEICVEKVLDFPFSLTNKPRIHRQYNYLSRHTEFLMLRYWHSVYQLTASG